MVGGCGIFYMIIKSRSALAYAVNCIGILRELRTTVKSLHDIVEDYVLGDAVEKY
ncbi:MAG: hypothetical protein ABWW69_01145 [Pyrodictiaceae archaeon]